MSTRSCRMGKDLKKEPEGFASKRIGKPPVAGSIPTAGCICKEEQ
jgi:hypothetical protein